MQQAVKAAPNNGRQDCRRAGPEHNSKDADQEKEADRDSPGLSEQEKAIVAVQTSKSGPRYSLRCERCRGNEAT